MKLSDLRPPNDRNAVIGDPDKLAICLTELPEVEGRQLAAEAEANARSVLSVIADFNESTE